MPKDMPNDKIEKIEKLKKAAERVEDLMVKSERHNQLIDTLKESKVETDAMVKAISQIKIEVPKQDAPVIPPFPPFPEIKIPEIKIPEIKLPEIKLPTINVPEPKVTVNVPKIDTPIIPPITIPPVVMPDEMTVKGNVGLVPDVFNPFPVQLRDKDGKPVSLGGVMSSGGGGNFGKLTAQQTDGSQKTQIVDEDGNTMASHLSSDGNYHLGVSIEQNVVADPNNSSTTNLTAANSYTFTGTATSTLGVAGLQISLKTDQNCTVYIEQSPDGTNWDISDSYDYLYTLNNFGITVQAINSYVRVRVILTGTTDTTYFRLQGILCPVVSPLPRSLNDKGRLKTSSGLIDVETQIREKVTPFGIMKTAVPIRMIGTSFSGTTKDTNFWTETVVTTGSVTQAGEITLATGTTALGSAKYVSNRKARHVAGCANEFKFTGRLTTPAQADNLRRCGVYDINDGFFFQVNGTTFGVGSRKGGVDTVVNSGSFNGNLGASVEMGTTMTNFVIWYWERTAYFFINGTLLHRIVASTTSNTNTLTFPITMENNNLNANTTDNSFEVLVASISRFGNLETGAKYYHLSGNAATHILKYGAGTLQKIMFNNTSGTNITIYDNTAGSGDVMGIITTTSNCIGEWTYNVPFSTGLTLVTTGNSLDATIIYE